MKLKDYERKGVWMTQVLRHQGALILPLTMFKTPQRMNLFNFPVLVVRPLIGKQASPLPV